MWSEITNTVEDGNLGANTSTATHVQAKIGVSATKSSVPILITSTMKPDEIKAKLGLSPLADACIDAAENGLKTIYAVPVIADAEGEIGEVQKTGTSQGSFSVEGKPNNQYDIVVEIIESGNNNEGSFWYSIDGGNNFSEEYTIPLSGEFELPGTGMVLKFTDSDTEDKSFLEGDAYSFQTVAPTMSNASVLKAVEGLLSFKKSLEMIHIVGTSGKALWAALQAKAEVFQEEKKPVIFLCEARSCRNDETLDEYETALEQERKNISSRYIAVTPTYATYMRKDRRIQNINMAGVISGYIGKAKESLSVGCVEEFPISSTKLIKLLPEGIESHLKNLDAMGYTVIRDYTDLEDFYIANGNVMSPDGSDFKYIEHVRVLNRIVREINKLATMKLQQEIDPENYESDIKAIEAYLNIAMDNAKNDKIISSGNVTIDTEDLNILADEKLDVNATWVPMGTDRVINITFAVNNPALAAN